jgi:trans-2,3-dihydro-3-hydroxyanthranilate isomerase
MVVAWSFVPSSSADPMSLAFHIVDVFAVEPLTGNPLVVVDGGGDLSSSVLGRIAREFNQSETTFVLPPSRDGADWRLRSFTPGMVEVFGAGHNALGAWWWLAESGRLALEAGETTFHQEIGESLSAVVVRHSGGRASAITMEQHPPVPGRRCDDAARLAAALGLAPADLALDRLPCQVVSTGAAHLLVPVRDHDAIDRLQPDEKALFTILESVGAEGCYPFSLDARAPGAVAYARFFNPTVGIGEDPATGTAAGPLVAHLVAHGLARDGQRAIVEQGTKMGRTSLIEITVSGDSVRISGRGVLVASGELRL